VFAHRVCAGSKRLLVCQRLAAVGLTPAVFEVSTDHLAQALDDGAGTASRRPRFRRLINLQVTITASTSQAAFEVNFPDVIWSGLAGVHDVRDEGCLSCGVRRGRGYLQWSITAAEGTFMRVQRVLIPSARVESWTVLGDDHVPVEPVERFLGYLSSIERAPQHS